MWKSGGSAVISGREDTAIVCYHGSYLTAEARAPLLEDESYLHQHLVAANPAHGAILAYMRFQSFTKQCIDTQ